MKVRKCESCGNSPKSLLAQALAIAIEKRDAVALKRCIAEEVEWIYPGEAPAMGKASAALLVSSAQADKPIEIEVEYAISHGKVGAASGTVKRQSGTRQRFCHVVEFASAKGERIAKITSFYAADQAGG